MDANGTRYHLLLGREDWLRCRAGGEPLRALSAGDEPGETTLVRRGADGPGVVWNVERNELTLQPLLFQFTSAPKDVPPTLEMRRGAARDRYGNWYWIDETEGRVRVLSEGTRRVSNFWPPDDASDSACPPDEGAGDFRAREPATAPPALRLRGLAVTEHHYLVVGVLEPAGLIFFDLHAGGPPQQIVWPESADFAPFDMAPAPGGGVLILDREHARFWTLDRQLNVVADAEQLSEPGDADDFRPRDGEGSAPPSAPREFPEGVSLADANDPIAIEALPDGTVLILDRAPGVSETGAARFAALAADEEDEGESEEEVEAEDTSEFENEGGEDEGDEGESDAGDETDGGDEAEAVIDERNFCRVFRYRGQRQVGRPASVKAVADLVVGRGAEQFALKGHDFAYVPAHKDERGASVPERLYVVSENGNQSFAFSMSESGGDLRLEPLADYLPMRLFGGRALARADASAFYDHGENWIPLVEQRRPRYAPSATLYTPLDETAGAPDGNSEELSQEPFHAFDGREPDCVWHRLMLDACIPPETEVLISSRAANDEAELALAEWQPEPRLYPRGGGSELPFAGAAAGYSTWELLFQAARGRFLQLRVELRGNGRTTPRLRALRAYYPRFSYLERYLPAVYREDAPSASFLDRFLSNFEGLYTSIEDRIASAQMLFDVRSAPAEALDWLADWFGTALDPAWEERRRRLFIKHAARLFRMRGTIRGLQSALRLSLEDCPDDSIFDDRAPSSRPSRAGRIRVVEKFLTRRTPGVVFGDPTDGGVPRLVAETTRWTPEQGADALHERYSRMLRETLGERGPRRFHVRYPGGRRLPHWRRFSLDALGFVPSAADDDRRRWQEFLCRRYGSVHALNAAHGARWRKPTRVSLPRDLAAGTKLYDDWREFAEEFAPPAVAAQRKWWQDFLARRYRNVRALNEAYGTNWPSFELVSLFDHLPPGGQPLRDWYQFEAAVLPMRRSAHRFTVLLPLPASAAHDGEAQRRRLELAERIVRLEKPAHTVFDIKLYWALFRVGEARLGEDTLLDVGSRAPQLLSPLVVGREYLAQSYLAPRHPQDVADRQTVGYARL